MLRFITLAFVLACGSTEPVDVDAGDAGDGDGDAKATCDYGEGPYNGTLCSSAGLTCEPSSLAVGCFETCTCDGTKFTCPGCPEAGND